MSRFSVVGWSSNALEAGFAVRSGDERAAMVIAREVVPTDGERAAMVIAREVLVPKGAKVIVDVDDDDVWEDYDLRNLDMEDDEFGYGIELVVSVAVEDYEYAEQRLDEFRDKVRMDIHWMNVPFGVTLQTIDERDAEEED